nr:ComF family protein [Allomuricauda sp.]
MAKILNEIHNILLPMVCFGCNAQLSRGESTLCTVCRHELPLTDYNFRDENPVDRIFYGRIPIKKAASFLFFSKTGIVQNLLHHLKYKNQEQIGGFLGNWYGSLLENEVSLKNVDAVIPVPLHPKKQRKRGYNQVSLFAKNLAHALGATYREDILHRTVNTKTQTKKDRQLRWENTKDVFQITEIPEAPKHILLVDDIITTGATLEACAKTLQKLGPVQVSVVSMAVVP